MLGNVLLWNKDQKNQTQRMNERYKEWEGALVTYDIIMTARDSNKTGIVKGIHC